MVYSMCQKDAQNIIFLFREVLLELNLKIFFPMNSYLRISNE